MIGLSRIGVLCLAWSIVADGASYAKQPPPLRIEGVQKSYRVGSRIPFTVVNLTRSRQSISVCYLDHYKNGRWQVRCAEIRAKLPPGAVQLTTVRARSRVKLVWDPAKVPPFYPIGAPLRCRFRIPGGNFVEDVVSREFTLTE